MRRGAPRDVEGSIDDCWRQITMSRLGTPELRAGFGIICGDVRLCCPVVGEGNRKKHPIGKLGYSEALAVRRRGAPEQRASGGVKRKERAFWRGGHIILCYVLCLAPIENPITIGQAENTAILRLGTVACHRSVPEQLSSRGAKGIYRVVSAGDIDGA